jgi:hypothetical protein
MPVATILKSEVEVQRRRSAPRNPRSLTWDRRMSATMPLPHPELNQAVAIQVDESHDDASVQPHQSSDHSTFGLENMQIDIVDADFISDNAVNALLCLLGTALEQIVNPHEPVDK